MGTLCEGPSSSSEESKGLSASQTKEVEDISMGMELKSEVTSTTHTASSRSLLPVLNLISYFNGMSMEDRLFFAE